MFARIVEKNILRPEWRTLMAYKICLHCGKKYDERDVVCECQKDRRNEYSKQYYENNKDLKKMLNSKRWRNLRRLVIQRDGGLCNRCYVQLGIFVSDELQVHHITPRSERPDLMFEEDNLITVCKTCNLQLGTSGELDWKIEKVTSLDLEVNL